MQLKTFRVVRAKNGIGFRLREKSGSRGDEPRLIERARWLYIYSKWYVGHTVLRYIRMIHEHVNASVLTYYLRAHIRLCVRMYDMYVHTYVRTYVCTYGRTYIHRYGYAQARKQRSIQAYKHTSTYTYRVR